MRRVVLVAVAAGLALAGCTDVPQSSSPTVIQSRVLQPPDNPPDRLAPNLTPSQVVTEFLERNGRNDPNHTEARFCLTSAANTQWTDDRVTVVNVTTLRTPVTGKDGTILLQVTGSKLGSIDPTGAYTPSLSGNGTTGSAYTGQFTLTRAGGEWRISKLPDGLLVTAVQFSNPTGTPFQQRSLYFFDSAEQQLVPDPRYTQLTDPTALATWLLRGLAAGPRDTVSTALTRELPDTEAARLTATVPDDDTKPVQLEIPGAGETDADQRSLLAAELAKTLEQIPSIGADRRIRILDGDETVSIPRIGVDFRAEDFADLVADAITSLDSPELYYVTSAGGVATAQGTPLRGKLGTGYYGLTSVALKQQSGAKSMLVAGVREVGGVETVDVGTDAGAFLPVDGVSGELSRPDWSPDRDEFWIGAGSRVYRVTKDRAVSRVALTTPNGQPVGRVAAVRFSPDGSRVAVVLVSTDADEREVSQVSVGVVVQSGAGAGSGGVRVEGLTPISPVGIAVTDIAWNDEQKIFGVGHEVSSGTAGLYEFQSDGSLWSPRSINPLPDEPDSITVAGGQDAAVSVNGTVWKQLAGTWELLRPGGDSPGTAPVYAR